MDNMKLPKTYDPHKVEQPIYEWWEEKGFFRPETQFELGLASPEQEPFVITMPPPNVTGALHLGHAITAALEDLMVRYHRMRGDPTLWLPGEDHASIAAQWVLEKELAKEGLTRHDLGREGFLERMWEWMRKYRHIIADQHRRLGTSCDWTRERFTMDEGLSRAVREAFVRLYREGLIYRGTYMINWCPRCESAISDLEVIHKEHDSHLWYVRYPLAGDGLVGGAGMNPWGSGRWAEGATEFITVATTRPETILGDTAVAVHPDDERYKHLIGRQAILPALGRRIPIIADEAVDPEFGTGAVKVTPAHDPVDYEVGQRHGLEFVNVMNDDATMNDEAGPYAGQDRYECRRNLVADLEKEGLLVKVEDYHHALGHCERCDTVIEPRISTQWFVRIKPLAEAALAAVRDGRIRIIPERFTKVYYNWLENIRDWCISRQLWWGHRIPVWYCDDCGEITVDTVDPDRCAHCGSQNIHQDEDVLDTWFSSGLWPFSTLGWPDDTPDFRYFYPTTVRETGYDILFFWVAREIMLGLRMTGDVPYRIVYLHGLIRDAKGQKISKSMPDAEKYDPLNIVERYGADALRFTLLTGSTPGNDMKLALERVEASRNFANKIWNAARFVIGNLGQAFTAGTGTWNLSAHSLADQWIISRSNRLIETVTQLIESYQFGEAGRQIHDFLWGEFCDWYIEIAKIRLYGKDAQAQMAARQVLVYVLERTLRLLHPFMPFVTEAIWQQLPHEGESIMIAPWPKPGWIDEKAEADMEMIMEVIRAIRNARAEYRVEPARRIEAIIVAGEHCELLSQQRDILTTLARLDDEKLQIVESLAEKPRHALALVVKGVEVYLPLAGMVDLKAEIQRLRAELEAMTASIARSQTLLANQDFLTKAPAHVVERERAKLAELRESWQKLKERLEVLES